MRDRHEQLLRRRLMPLVAKYSAIFQERPAGSCSDGNIQFAVRYFIIPEWILSLALQIAAKPSRVSAGAWPLRIKKAEVCQGWCDVRWGSFASVWPDHGDFRSTPVNGHSQDRRACLKGVTKRHPACTPLANFLNENLAFTRKVKVNTTFLVRERYGRLSTPCLRT